MRIHVTLPSFALLLTAAACGDNSGNNNPDATTAIDGTPVVDAAPVDAGDQAVTLRFAAHVDGTPFACGTSYPGIGSTGAAYVASDFRFFVHDVALIPVGGGTPVPVVLDENDHQADSLALLDFEDGTAACQMGSAATYTSLVGRVAAGSYDGLTLTIGVPEARNHLDPAGQAAPLNEAGMFWAWQSGYKFMKVDGAVGAQGFNLHVGSTGCPGGSPTEPPTGPCVNPNRPSITLAGFDPTADVIVADVAAVLADVDVSTNTAATAPGCMSFPGDPECDTIFPKLGLPFGANPAGGQAFLRVQ